MQGPVAGQPLHRLARDRRPFLELGGRRAQLALQAFDRGVDAEVGPHAMARRQPTLVHGLLGQLDHGIRPPLLGRPPVIPTQGTGQGIDGQLDREPRAHLQPAVDPIHVAALADEELDVRVPFSLL